MKKAWTSLAPPVQEQAIVGKWYAVIYQSKRNSNLFIGKVLRRFLTDENGGNVDSVEVRCLKPKVGLGTTLEDTPAHLPDISIFKLEDVIAGPLQVTPLKRLKFEVPAYQSLVAHFKAVEKLDRTE